MTVQIMNILLLSAFALLLQTSVASVPGCTRKRRRQDNNELDYTMTRNRFVKIKRTLDRAFMDGDVEYFTEVYHKNSARWPSIWLQPNHFEEYLSQTVELKQPRMLQRLLSYAAFRAQFNSNHLYCILHNKDIDSFWAVIKAPFTDEERAKILKKSSLINYWWQLTCSAGSAFSGLFLEWVEPCLEDVENSALNPTSVKNQLLTYSPDIEEEHEVLTAILLHMGYRSFRAMLQIWFFERRNLATTLGKSRANFARKAFELASSIKQEDWEGVRRIIDDTTPLLLDDFILVVLELVVALNKIQAFELLADFAFQSNSLFTRGYQRFKLVLKNALIHGSILQTTQFLGLLFPEPSGPSQENILLSIADEAIGGAELDEIERIMENWPDYVALPRKAVLNLINNAKRGDWRYLLVFMQANPNRIRLAQAAWNLMLDPKRGDQFLDFVSTLQYINLSKN